MTPRAIWRGHLKFALVGCAVSLSPATSERDKVRFRLLNKRTEHRLRGRYVDARAGRPVGTEDQAKGYPVAEDRHVLLEDEELEAVALESARTIDIETFVPNDSVGWVWLDRPHHLLPDDTPGAEAFAVIREVLRRGGVVGVARLVLNRRERAVMIEPRDKGLVLWTLRYGDEVRDPSALFREVSDEKPDPRALKLFRKLIEARTRPWDPDMVRDPVQDKLLDIIAAKTARRPAARKVAAPPDAPDPTDVVSILEALRKSVADATKV